MAFILMSDVRVRHLTLVAQRFMVERVTLRCTSGKITHPEPGKYVYSTLTPSFYC